MEQYLIDTNIVSHYLSSTLPNNYLDFIDSVVNDIPNISVISQIELLCWNSNSINTENIKKFVSDCNILPINDDVIAHCVAIRKGRKIKTPDAIIAATAIANNLILISNDTAFLNIQNLKIVNLL
jgi:predicted nucleic acid-binding protein